MRNFSLERQVSKNYQIIFNIPDLVKRENKVFSLGPGQKINNDYISHSDPVPMRKEKFSVH